MKLALTHYDILNVTRDAPQEVIRAAYKALCRKYHPDLNADATATNHVMAVINVSYDILSSPSKRRAYDDWILEQESLHGCMAALLPSWENLTRQATPGMPLFAAWIALGFKNFHAAANHAWRHAGVYALASLAVALSAIGLLNPDGEQVRLESVRPPALSPLTAREQQQMPAQYPQLALTKTATMASSGASPAGYAAYSAEPQEERHERAQGARAETLGLPEQE